MDALTLSALIGSRICHDTLTPVGSINNGFEILDDPTTPEEMKKSVLAMIQDAVRSAHARLTFSRMAFGTALQGGQEGSIAQLHEIRELLSNMFSLVRPALAWRTSETSAPPAMARMILTLAWLGHECVPRGGEVGVYYSEEGDSYRAEIRCIGDRAHVPDMVLAGLRGDEAAALANKAAVVPFFIALLLAENAAQMEWDQRKGATSQDDVVAFRVQMRKTNAQTR